MIVNCGDNTDDTVDLATFKLIDDKRLGEITERSSDFCGSTFIDEEFIKFLREKLGTRAIDLLMKNDYHRFQYMVRSFCRYAKVLFSGDTEFCYKLDIIDKAPILLQYVSKEIREFMEENDWLIKIKYNDIKKMFDPIVDRIIHLIHLQLSNNRE